MKLIESDIIKMSKWDRVQGFNRSEDKSIVCNKTNDKCWDEYQFKEYLLTEEEYKRLIKFFNVEE